MLPGEALACAGFSKARCGLFLEPTIWRYVRIKSCRRARRAARASLNYRCTHPAKLTITHILWGALSRKTWVARITC